MRPARVLSLAALLFAAVTGCADTGHQLVARGPSPSRTSPSHTAGAPTVADPFPQRAAKLASAWNGSSLQQVWESGYVPLQDTTHLSAGAFHSGADKAAYDAGQFRLAVTLPSGPARQTVRFDHGAARTLPGVSAENALHSESLGHCPTASCPTWLTVTGVRATTERVRTSQGMATVPAWAFRLQGYQGEFVYAAVKPEARLGTAPGQGPTPPPVLPGYQGATVVSVSPDGRTLTLGTTTGCGKLPPTGLVYETKDVVVVGATDRAAPMSPGTVCTADLRIARVQVRLSDVLDGRTVIDVADGQPEAPLG